MHDGTAVSSTRIRRELADDGNVEDVAVMLTRLHEVAGEVVPGDRRGRTIGFPTANLRVRGIQLPKDGVYSVFARVLTPPGDLLRGVANLGNRPTFEAGRSVEVHLLDFEGDLYGNEVRIGFASRIRGEQKFDGLESLKAQIAKDCDAAKNALQQTSLEWARWI